MQRLEAGRVIAGSAQRLAIERDQVGRVGPQGLGPRHEAGLEQPRIDPVEDHPQPVLLGRAEVVLGITLQEAKMMLAPIGDLVIIIAARDRSAGDEEQHFSQRVFDLAGLTRIADRAEVVEQEAQTILDQNLFHGVRLQNESKPHESCRPPSRQTSSQSVNLTTVP